MEGCVAIVALQLFNPNILTPCHSSPLAMAAGGSLPNAPRTAAGASAAPAANPATAATAAEDAIASGSRISGAHDASAGVS
eukprot:12893921-Prorocentrum_lima.AAC.1